MRVPGQQLRILIKPGARIGRALDAAGAVTLTAGLDPDNAVHVRVLRLRRRGLPESSLDVAPLPPLGAGALDGHTALVDDKAGGKSFGLEVRDQGEGIVALVEGVAVLGVGLGSRR